MKKPMTQFCFLCASLLLLASCSNDDTEGDLERSKKEDTYVFQKIEYFLAEDDGTNTVKLSTDEYRFENRTNNEYSATHYPLKDITDISSFENDATSFLDWVPNLVVPKDTTVHCPALITEGRVYTDVEERRLFLQDDPQISPVAATRVTLGVTPYMQYTYVMSYERIDMTVSYVATYVGRNTNTEIEVKGKWKGCRYNSLSSKTNAEPITVEK